MQLGEKIHILRKARGFSQEQLGLSLSTKSNGVSRQSVSDWESGKSEPKLDNIRALAELLDVSYDVLLDEEIDLNNKEYLNQVLNGTYEKKSSVLSATNYYINRKIFGVVPIILCLLVIGVSLGVLVPAYQNAQECFAQAAGRNGDASVMGMSLNTRGNVWVAVTIVGAVLAAIGVPLCVVYFFHTIKAKKPLGVLNEEELILYPSRKQNTTKTIKIKDICGVNKSFFGNIAVKLSNGETITLVQPKNPKHLMANLHG